MRSGSALPAWLKIWMRPPPFLFLFFDTRRRSSLIAYRSLRHLTVTHTDTHIRLNQKKKKKHTPQLHRWGGGHRYQMRFVSKRAPMAVWGVCPRSTHGAVDLWTPLFSASSPFLDPGWGGNEQSYGLFSLPTFIPVNHFVCVGRTIPNCADVSTASKQPVGFWKSFICCVPWMTAWIFHRVLNISVY